MAITTPADVAAAVLDATGRELTATELTRAQRRIDAAVNTLEGVLHRTLELGTFAEEYTPDPQGHVPSSAATGWSTLSPGYGVVHLRQRPVVEVTSVTVDGAVVGYHRPSDDIIVVGTTRKVLVTYSAGDSPPHPEVVEAVTNAVARGFMVPGVVAAGVDMTYTVEGTSVGYGQGRAAGSPGTARYGPFTPDEISGLRASLGRIVIR